METFKQSNEQEDQKADKSHEKLTTPIVIGIEGGPCSGKTTFVESLKFISSERPIVVLPEAATQIIEKCQQYGIDVIKLAKNSPEMLLKFESEVLELTFEQIEKAKNEFYGTNAVIVADRVDIGGYLGQEEYAKVLSELGWDKPPMLELVDKILYFPTLAKKDPDEYMRQWFSNPCRTESPEEAIERCNLSLEAVIIHPEFRYMDQGDFKDTLEAAKQIVLNSEIEL